MPRVKCPAATCVYWDDGYCGAEEIVLDPEDLSCTTFEELGDLELEDDEFDEDEWDEDEYSLEVLEDLETRGEEDEDAWV
ncbi:MAG: DUF1540 domain-containing protein [Chloroflexi bacterium]|nr:DUF1540 domain-containing protein [Chloroflexota bacterium]